MLNMCNFSTRMKQGSLGEPSLHSCFKRNGNCSIIHAQSSIHWAIMFLTGIWNLWLHRNAAIYSNKCLYLRLKYLSLSQAMEILPIYPQTMHLQPGLLFLKWETPPVAWFNSKPMVPLKEFEIVCAKE